MKKPLITLLLLICIQVAHAQTLVAKITSIRTAVEKINKVSGYKIKILSNEEFLDEMTDGGGELKAFYKNGALVKITVHIYLSSCINITDYYFEHDQLIFTYTQGKEWYYDEKTNTLDPKKVSLKMECRLYFNNSKLIKSNIKGTYRCGRHSAEEMAKNDLNAVIAFQKKLRNK